MCFRFCLQTFSTTEALLYILVRILTTFNRRVGPDVWLIWPWSMVLACNVRFFFHLSPTHVAPKLHPKKKCVFFHGETGLSSQLMIYPSPFKQILYQQQVGRRERRCPVPFGASLFEGLQKPGWWNRFFLLITNVWGSRITPHSYTYYYKNSEPLELGGGFKDFSPYLGKISNLTSIFLRWVGSTTNEGSMILINQRQFIRHLSA